MPITETSSAYLAGPKNVEIGTFSHTMLHTVAATASASANALVVLGQKIQNGLYLMGMDGGHTSGAASCPVDIGVDASPSAFATQVTQGINVVPSTFKVGVFPYKSSVSDDAAALYQVIKYALSAGTNTTGIILNYTTHIARDPY